ncbi:hypothetical protein [Kribbella sp. VKM Ac-2568]|uniref:hypothetical protein n=1 Tax=Kribbella sp. VKM Ac-2568 TaxID=2512219 RepID=UPI0010ECCB34|nr:hypothetical protein [Kribbella sp. VKM Ac-2568]TCM43385.1 hypothetical protein EV648_1092 [Kribbella sp. VKM Ac-2568]
MYRPGSQWYDAAHRPAIANFDDIPPGEVVQCASAGDVAKTIAFARPFGLGLTARHNG